MFKKIRKILIFTLILAIFTPILSVTAAASVAPDMNKQPRMITVSFYGTDGTKMAFNWNTTDFTDSDVWVVEASDNDGFSSSAVIKTSGSYYVSKASTADGFIHTAVCENLKKGTKYLYKVGDAELNAWSEVGSFITESGDNSPFTFVHVSDPQSDDKNYYDTYRQVLSAAAKETTPRFFINTGDIVNNNWLGYTPNLDQWEWALTNTFSVMKDYPLMATAGNHEAADYDFSSRFNFDVPVGSDVKSGTYYSYNYNNVHFIALNTNDTVNNHSPEDTGISEAQLNWLKQDLERNKDAEWIVVTMHKGIYDCGDGANNTLGTDYDVQVIRTQVAPLFTEFGVDLVLQGHDHLYSKSYPISTTVNDDGSLKEVATTKETVKTDYNGKSVDLYTNPNGTVYINSGTASGWKTFVPVESYDKELIELSDKGMIMYTAITVDGNKMIVSTYTLDGKFNSVPYYSFGIEKTGDGGIASGTISCGGEGTRSMPIWGVILLCVLGVMVLGGVTVVIILFVKKRK